MTDNDYPERIAELARKDPNRWREVALLTGAKATRGSKFAIWPLVEALCYGEPTDIDAGLEEYWGALIAGQMIVESADITKVSDKDKGKVVRVKKWLLKFIRNSEIPSTERSLAGNVLAQIGDTRQDVLTLDNMKFCYVPAGEFKMGEGENVEVNYGFWIALYPVTSAQFNEFIKDKGYKEEKYWMEAKVAGIWKNVKFKGRWDDKFRKGPYRFGFPFNLSNHPVVGVSWYEALAFTRWITERWQKKGILPEKMAVDLSSEVEWEKAARGGFKIPKNYVIKTVKDINRNTFSRELKENNNSTREYPWDGEINTNITNYSDTGIGATSAVGCFPGGKSTCYGCEEMSGNVWELTRSNEDGSVNLEASPDISRVLRGGSFSYDRSYLRCSYRDRLNPYVRNYFIGFRVVVVPI